jgi:toxin ParE1/3/4
MTTPRKVVKLHAEAKLELEKSVRFYRERAGERWAERFKQRVVEGIKAIAADPERYSRVAGLPGVQRIRLRQFPFSLLYINRAEHVWVVAVAHGSRRPGYWRKRTA